jgi:hypothetical protein
MPSLTPGHRSDEATSAAFRDGLVSGGLALIPSSLAVYTAMQTSKTFVKSTNWQSRTALVIMPALFSFAFSSEHTLNNKMQQMANDVDHSRKVTEWAEKKQREEVLKKKKGDNNNDESAELKLHALYRKSVEESGVRVVPELGVHHQVANFFQANPFKILVAVGVPTVLYIFKGKTKSKHLQLQSQLMHTRVYGQFAVITMLLTLMGFKTYMDNSGKYITEAEAEFRVQEMNMMRQDLLEKLAREKEMKKKRDQIFKNAKQRNSADKLKKRAVTSIENA